MTELLAPARLARPYPADAVELRAADDGRPLLIRPLAPGDGALLADFVRGLSPHSRYQRFQSVFHELPPGLLAQLLQVDYGERMAFVAVLYEHGRKRMIGEARYAPSLDRPGASEFALAVTDAWQRRGIGTLLFSRLLRHAAATGIEAIHGDVLHDNAAMLGLARSFGLSPRRHPDGGRLTRVEHQGVPA